MATLSRARALIAIAAMVAGAGLAALLGFVAQVVLARAFDAAVLGAFAVAVTVATVVMPIAVGGLHWFENDARVLAQPQRWQPALAGWFRRSLPLGVAAAGLTTLAFGYPPPVALAAASLTLALACIERALAQLQGAGRFQWVAWLQTSAYAARLAAVLLAVALVDERWLWWGVVASQVALAAWLIHRFALLSTRGRASEREEGPEPGQVSAELLPLAGLSLLQLVSTQLDRVLVAATQEAAVTGVYAAAAGFILLAELLPKTAAMRFLLPRLGQFTSMADGAGARWLIMRVAALALLSGTMLAAALDLGGGWLIRVAFGAGFEPAAALLTILAWMLPARFLRIALEPWFLGTMKRGRAVAEAVFVAISGTALGVVLAVGSLQDMLRARIVIECLFAGIMLILLLQRSSRLGTQGT